jgi:hypothetical protein
MVALSLSRIGLGFTIIVGGSAIVAYFVWLLTTYRYPVDGRKILPLYLVAIGMQFIHLTEEYVADIPDNFSALTGSHFSPNAFVLIAVLAGGIAYLFAGFGLIHHHPVANYLLWFFLIGPVGLVNTIAHFTFPFLAGSAYFPGLLTVILPTTFGTALAVRVIQDGRPHWFARAPSAARLSAAPVRAD